MFPNLDICIIGRTIVTLNRKRQRKREIFKTWWMKSVSFSTLPEVKIQKCWHRFCGVLLIVDQVGVLSTGSSCWGITVQPWGQTQWYLIHCTGDHTATLLIVCVCAPIYSVTLLYTHSCLNTFKDSVYKCSTSKIQTWRETVALWQSLKKQETGLDVSKV